MSDLISQIASKMNASGGQPEPRGQTALVEPDVGEREEEGLFASQDVEESDETPPQEQPSDDDLIPEEFRVTDEDDDVMAAAKRAMYPSLQKHINNFKAEQAKAEAKALELQKALQDPQTAQAIAAYHAARNGQANPQQQEREFENPYGAVAVPDDPDIDRSSWDANIRDTRSLAYEVVAKDFYPAVEGAFTQMAQRVVALEERLQETALSDLGQRLGIEDFNKQAVIETKRKYPNMSDEDAAWLAHREALSRAKERGPVNGKQAGATRQKPQQPQLRSSTPHSFKEQGVVSFEDRLTKRINEALRKHPQDFL